MLPSVMQKLLDQTQGSFNDTDGYIKQFFKDDLISSPRYRLNEQDAAKMMAMRTDSRGSPLQRSYCGSLDIFVQGQKMIQKRQQEKVTKQRGNYLARLAANTVLQ